MRVVSLLLAITFTAIPAVAQESGPISASIAHAARTAAERTSPPTSSEAKGALFWSGLVVGLAGVTTSALGLTVFRTEDTSTGNAPDGTYKACVALRDSNSTYVGNQCDGLKGKNLKLLWGGVALSGVGAILMIRGSDISADVSSGRIGLFRHWKF